MTPFVTVDDLEDFAGEADNFVRAEMAVRSACDEIRHYLSQQLNLQRNDTITLNGTGTRALLLPQLPVVAVNSVLLDGDAITDWSLGDDGILWRTDDTATSYVSKWWPHGYANVTVDYDHGYAVEAADITTGLVDTVPEDIKMVALRIAKLIYDDADRDSRLTQRSIGDYSESFAASGSQRVETSAYLATLDRRVVKRVPVA